MAAAYISELGSFPGTALTVYNQIVRLNNLADELINKTEEAVMGLQYLTFQNVDLDPRLQWSDTDLQNLLDQLGDIPGFDPNSNWLLGLDLSAGDENFAFDPNILALLSQMLPEYILPPAPGTPVLPDPPQDPGEPTALTAPAKPTLPTYDAPDTEINEAEPEYEDYTSQVQFPTLREILVDSAPTLHLDTITFDATEPDFDGQVPDAAMFQFTGVAYEPLLVEETKAAILRMMNGESGLPPAVEEAMFERAREIEAEQAAREVEVVSTEYAAKGYKYPAGTQAKRIDRVRADAMKKISALNREQFIKTWEIQIEQFRTALASAISLEDIWMKQYITTERLRFDAAQMQMTFSMGIFNSFVTRLNAQATIFGIKAEIYKTRIEGETMKLNAYTEELKGKQIIGELNAQDVAIYAEKLKALLTNAEIYKARVDGFVSKFAAIEARVKVFESQLSSNQTLAQIYESDTKAFATLTQAQSFRDDRFKTKAEIYSTTIGAKKVETDALLALYDVNFKKAELQKETFVANSQRITEMIAAESARIQALSEKYQALASEIGAKSEVEKAKYALMLALANANVERMKAAAEILLKNGEINIQSGLQAENLMLRARETATTTLAQLAAGFTSAANVSASIGANDSYSVSISKSLEDG